MFKVSLLPASYRKKLLSKKRRNLIEKVAVIVLFCLLIVYAGIAARYIILSAQLKKVQNKNMEVEAQILELQKYKTIYDELEAAKKKVEDVKARDMSALEFVSVVQATRPKYIRINAISTQDWQNTAICVISGDLPSADNLRTAVNELDKYAKTFTELEEYKGVVKQVRVTHNNMPVKDEETGAYSFTIVISLTDTELQFDENWVLLTTETTTVEETTAPPNDSANDGGSAENTETPAEETTTAAEGDQAAEDATEAEG
ncbi:MAG: hypothetical protein K5761_08730 [Clostridiales bacterium]|nr:hypothetical protein [Clostridiales bacterium]